MTPSGIAPKKQVNYHMTAQNYIQTQDHFVLLYLPFACYSFTEP